MCLSGVQVRTRLDSRLKHAGMTTLGRSKLRGMNPQRFKLFHKMFEPVVGLHQIGFDAGRRESYRRL